MLANKLHSKPKAVSTSRVFDLKTKLPASMIWFKVSANKRGRHRENTYIYGTHLPNVCDKHESLHSEQFEYDRNDVESVDMTGLPLQINHNDNLRHIGELAAYEPYVNGNSNVLGKMFTDNTPEQLYAETALMNGMYKSLSLTHSYQTTYKANSNNQATAHTTKIAKEVSLCREPGRENADIIEVFPSRNAMLRSNRANLNKFASNYLHEKPPILENPDDNALLSKTIARNNPVLKNYVDQVLLPSVDSRMDALFAERGFVRASKQKYTAKELATTGTTSSHKATLSSIDSNTNESSFAQPPQQHETQSTTPMQTDNQSSGAVPNSTSEQASSTMAVDENRQSDVPPTPSDAANGRSILNDANAKAQGKELPSKTMSDAASSSISMPDSELSLDDRIKELRTTATERSVNLDEPLSANDTLEEQMLKMAFQNLQQSKRVAEYEQKERERQEAAEKAAAAAEAAKIDQFQTGVQASAAMALDTLDASDESKEAGSKALQDTVAMMKKYGVPFEEMQKTIGQFGQVIVSASRDAQQRSQAQSAATQRKLASTLARTFGQTKTGLTMTGGELPNNNNNANQNTTAATTPASTAATQSIGKPPNGMTMEEYLHYTKTANSNQQSPSAETGTVSASREKMEGARAAAAGGQNQQQQDEITEENFHEKARDVYASLVAFDEQTGQYQLPAYNEVAHGGMVTVGVVRRNAEGREFIQEETRPRFEQKQRIGMQHLFPEVTKKVNKAFSTFTTAVPEREWASMVTSSQSLERQFPTLQSAGRPRRRANGEKYTSRFFWINDMWAGSESKDMELPFEQNGWKSEQNQQKQQYAMI